MVRTCLKAICFLLLFCPEAFSQNYNISNSTINTCGGNFYDSGGNGGTYNNNESYVMTFCSSSSGNCIRLTFTQFNIENGYDFLTVYNGPNTASPVMGTYTGTTLPPTLSSTSGCLTIEFTSDIIITSTGWAATLSCVPCPASACPPCNGGTPPANDACSGAQNLGALPAPAACPNGIGAWANFNTTNICATAESPYTTLTGCQPAGNMASPAADVWYRFTITGPTLNIQIAGLQSPNIGLYTGTNCSNLIGRGCAVGGAGILNTSFGGLAPGTYYLQVSGGNLSDQCDFTIGLQNNYDCAGCVIQSSFTANPPPVNGQYTAGQTVNFCFTISDYNQTSINWLHGVVPSFGAGWDMSTLTTTPANDCSGQGTWSWYNTSVTSTATGMVTGPGFYYESPLGNPLGVNDGNPGNNFGDNNPSNLCDWTFCWSITTLPPAACVQGASLNITVDTYGDGESGSWTSLACVGDAVFDFFATLACCAPPAVAVTNPVCPGQNTGSATASGQGTSPWDYVWKDATGVTIQTTNNVSGSNTINNLAPGNYTVTVTDNTGCTSAASFTIAAPTPINLSLITTNADCNGTATGSIDVNASGGSGALTFSLNGGPSQSGTTFNNLIAGNYSVVVTDANGCTATAAAVVSEPPALQASVNTLNALCFGGTNGSITVNASGGTGTLNYSLNGGASQSSNIFGILPAGNYSIIVTDARGCTITVNPVITQPPAVQISAIFTDVLCNGTSTGTITANANGGTGSFSYHINGGAPQASPVFNGLPAGVYNVVAVDANGCQAATNVVIGQPTTLQAAISQTNALCNGASDGTIAVNANGGTGAYNFSLNGGASQPSGNFTGLTAGNYSVTVTDANGCTVTLNAIVTEPSPVQASISATNALCNGSADGTVTINANGGTGALSYSLNGGTGQPTGNFTGLAAGNYTVVVTDANNCSATVSIAVTEPTPVQASISATNALCNGSADGTVTVNANGGTGALSYSLNGGAGQPTGNFTGLAAGNYTVVVTDANNCSATVSIAVTEPTPVQASISATNALCNGSADGTVTVNANGGTGALSYSLNGGAGQPTGNFTGLTAGNYTVVVTDANNCSATVSIAVTEPTPVQASISATNALCNGSADGTVTVNANGGTGALSYSLNGGAGQPTGNFTGLTAGNYTVVVTDANNCSATVSIAVTEPTPVQASISATNALCNGSADGTVTVNANGGTGALSYSLNGGAGQPTGNFTGLTAGNYTVVVTDANNCSATVSIAVTEPTPVLASISATNALCNGSADGTVTVNANGGTGALSYSLNGGAGQPTGNFTGLTAGNYTVVVTDANNCSATVSIAVTEPTPVQASISATNTLCNGSADGTVTVNANGGTGALSYSLNGGAGQPTGNFTGLTAGNYTVVVTDANNCSATVSITVTEPVALTASSASTPASCGGSNGSVSVTAAGGTSPLQYSINNGSSFQPAPNFSGLTAGNYDVLVSDANGCTITVNISVSNTAAPVINNTTTSDLTCFNSGDGSLSVTASGGTPPLQFSIDNGVTFQSGSSFSNLTAGTYAIVVSDVLGCQATTTVTINQPALLTCSAQPVNTTCSSSNGSIQITTTGGTGSIQFSLNGSANQASGTYNGLAAGNYSIIVTDANGCTASTNTILTDAPGPVITSIAGTDITCNGSGDGQISITTNGGTAPVQFSINGGATFLAASSFTGLASGTYSIMVSDANGCTQTGAVTINEPPLIQFTTSSTPASCGNSDGTLSVNASGGTANLTYSIDNGSTFQSSPTFSNLIAGTYNLVVQDANGCQVSGTATVNNAAAPVISNVTITDVTCNGASNGSLSITSSGGTGAILYSIDNGNSFQALPSFSNLTPGTYNIVVEDANGCQDAATATITEPQALSATAVIVNETCTAANGSVTINAAGGTGNLTFSISGGSGSQSSNLFSNLPAGNYTVTVQDANGCTTTTSVNITNAPGPLISSIPATDLTCNGSNDGTITINIAGGTQPVQYSIDNGANFLPSASFNSLPSGIYQILVSDANGCTASGNATITEPAAITASATVTDATCGNNDGTITITANGGTIPFVFSIDNGVTFQANPTITALLAGSYTIIIQDANGCQNQITATINNISAPVIQNVISTNVTCNGLSDGSINIMVTGGTAPLNFSSNGGFSYQGSGTFNGLSAGNYNLIIMDGNGCQDAASVTITEPSSFNLSLNVIGETCSAANGSVTINAGGGTGILTYSLSSIPGFQSSNTFSNLSAGTFTVTVQDGNGCTSAAPLQITDAPGPVITASTATDITCNGANDGSITISSTGGTLPLQFSIDNGTTYSTGSTFNALSAGTYQTIVMDANGCTASSSTPISEPLAISASVTTTPATCGNNDGTIAVVASGGIAPLVFSINNGSTFQASSTFNALLAGSYTVLIEDANGCQNQLSTSITNTSAPVIQFLNQSDITCNGAGDGSITITINGGTAPYNYSINGGFSFQPTGTFNGLMPGTYNILINDANGCDATATATINEPALLQLSTVATAATCGNNNGTLAVNATGGTGSLTYTLNGGSSGTTGSYTNLSPGSFSVVVTDANGCSSTVSATVANAPGPVVSLVMSTDAMCFGMNNGSISIIASNGTPPLQYSINGGATYFGTNVFDSIGPGNYAVMVMDANNCTASGNSIITQPSQVTYSVNVVDATCGNNNGSITFTASGGTGNYTYSLDNGATFQASNVFTGLPAGNYDAVVRDGSDCTNFSVVPVNNTSAPAINATPFTNVTCNGSSDGSITINAAGGTAPLNYSSNAGFNWQTSPSFTNLGPGNYQIVVSDANGCTATSSVLITEPSAITGTITTTTATCGNNDGSVSAAALGGFGTLTYSVNNGPSQPSGNFQNLAAGNYNVMIIDASGCTLTLVGSVSNTNAPIINSVAATNPLCSGAVNGSITVNAAGGTGALTYSINNGVTFQSSGLFNSLPGGSYSIVVTDATNCITTASVILAEPDPVQVGAIATDATCGNSNGTLTLLGTGGTAPLTYSINNGSSFQPAVNYQNLSAGSYTIIVNDFNGCSSSITSTISNQAGPVLSTPAIQNIDCNGAANGSIAVNIAGGTSPISYSINNGTSSQNSNLFQNLLPGTYQILVTDFNGCAADTLLTITEPAPISTSLTTTGAVCSGSNASITVSASGGTGVLTYSADSGFVFQSAPTFFNLGAGIYNIVVADQNGCTSVSSAVITDAPGPVINNINITDITCNGFADGSIGIITTGGTTPLSYSINNGISGQSTPGFTALGPGGYQILVTDANGCTAVQSAVISQPDPLNVLNMTTPALCFGSADGTASLLVTGGTNPYSINWIGTTGSGVNATNLAAGTYPVTVTDANGCSVTDSATVTEPAPIVLLGTTTDVSCNGFSDGTVSVNGQGGTGILSYLWQSVSFSGNILLSIPAGMYTVIASDANGCTAQQTYTISEPAPILVTTTSNPALCYGATTGNASVAASGGTAPYNYLWSNGSVASSISGIAAGIHTVSVTDDHGCIVTTNVTVSEPDLLMPATTATDLSCYQSNDGSASVSITGGTSPFQYMWNNSATTASITAVAAGSYSVTVTDANGCTAVQTIVVNEPTQLAVLSLATGALCNGSSDGTASLLVSGGTVPYSYNWSGVSGSTATVNGLSAGIYPVTVTDANGCIATDTITVTEPAAISLQGTVADVSCNGLADGTINVSSTGGTGVLSYVWPGANFSGNVLVNAPAGTYTVVATDANGCSTTQLYTISEPAILGVSTSYQSALCFGTNTGSVSATVTGGTQPYSYAWTGGATASTVTGIPAGTYAVTVTDDHGCITNGTVTITEPAQLQSAITSTDLSCYQSADGTAAVQVTGGTGPFSFVWNNGQTTPGITGISAGNYSVTITDQNGCTINSAVLVTEPDQIQITLSGAATLCIGQSATISASVTGGNGGYTYLWNNGAISVSQQVSPSVSTSYTVSVTDSNGCTAAPATVNINVNPPLSLIISDPDTICFGQSAVVSATAGGGNGGPYTYSWTNSGASTGQFSVTPSSTTVYAVSVNDGCGTPQVSASVEIVVNPLPVVSFYPVPASGCAPLSVHFTNNSTTTSPGAVYQWQFGDQTGSTDFEPGHLYETAGVYDVTLIVTSAEGCVNQLTLNDTIRVYPVPEAAFSASPPRASILNPYINFIDQSYGASTWQWEFSDNTGSFEQHPTHVFSDTGTYQVALYVTNDYGCRDSAFSEIVIEGSSTVYIPNAFTPNHDGHNDTFTVSGLGITGMQMSIFNRWGNLIFKGSSLSEPWDGKDSFSGIECPDDVYVYVVRVQTYIGADKEFTGRVTLVR